MYEYVSERVQAEGLQEPKQWALNLMGGDVRIARSGREPRKERAERLRLRLLDLAKQDSAFDDVFTEARRFIYLPSDDLDEAQQQKDSLLNQLDTEELTPIVFFSRWQQLESGRDASKAQKLESDQDADEALSPA